MDNLLNSGIPIILAFQSLGEWLLAPMEWFSFLGTEDFYILIIPVLYWSIDSALALRVGVVMLLSSSVNTIFKFAFHSPRPYWVNADVKALSAESSFGVPSGHAQNAIAIWGMVGSYFKTKWAWVVAIFFILGISLSRLYLAVHFPVDTVLGLVVGFLLLWVVNRAWNPVSVWAQKESLSKQIFFALAGSLALIFMAAFVAWIFRDWAMPTAWLQNAARAGGEAPHPYSLSGIISSAGTLFGLFAGLAWINQHGAFDASGSSKERFLRYLVGLVGLIIIYIGLKVVFPSGDNFVAFFFRYLRYTLLGFWVSGGAPFIFIKLNLADSNKQ
ncbi:MAG: phosphatase PAP2 family protein [Chloroflexi bacterium]|nr:phosphatase PAP2 family protein [Chloroflexota bacterium]